MPGTTPRHGPVLSALVLLLACAGPSPAQAAPPIAQASKPAAAQDSVIGQTEAARAKAKAKTGQSAGGKRTTRGSDDTARQAYQPLVDAVREGTEAFRDENVSENAERDRLPDPPPR